MSIYQSAARAEVFEPKSDSTVILRPIEIDADGEGEFVDLRIEMPPMRAELELFIRHYPEGSEHSHWKLNQPYPKVNGEYQNFDDFLAAYSGSNDSEAGNIKLDNVLREFIDESWQRWADETNRRAAEDAYDRAEADGQFWGQRMGVVK